MIRKAGWRLVGLIMCLGLIVGFCVWAGAKEPSTKELRLIIPLYGPQEMVFVEKYLRPGDLVVVAPPGPEMMAAGQSEFDAWIEKTKAFKQRHPEIEAIFNFDSLEKMRQWIARLPAEVDWVSYDYERWQFTPEFDVSEERTRKSFEEARRLAQQHGKRLLLTPSAFYNARIVELRVKQGALPPGTRPWDFASLARLGDGFNAQLQFGIKDLAWLEETARSMVAELRQKSPHTFFAIQVGVMAAERQQLTDEELQKAVAIIRQSGADALTIWFTPEKADWGEKILRMVRERRLKVYISVDMDGTGGTVHGSDVGGNDPDYQMFRRVLTDEVNAAIEGALRVGAGEILVEEHHGAREFRNVLLDQLHPQARLIRGWPRPRGGITGLDSSFDAAMFLGYHAREGTPRAVLAHTFFPQAVADFRINGRSVGEGEFNALVAGAMGVPVVLVAGDNVVVEQMRQFLGDVEGVTVKQALSKTAAIVVPPSVSAARIREAAERALRRLRDFKPVKMTLPYRAEFDYKPGWEERIGQVAERYPEIKRTAPRTLARTCQNVDELIDFYVKALGIEVEEPERPARGQGAGTSRPGAGASTQSSSPASGRLGRTSPIILILPTYRDVGALIEAWNQGLGKPFDLVVNMPTPEDLQDTSRLERNFARVKFGQHAWVTPSFALVQQGEAKIPATVKWFFYDPEPWEHTPKEELENLVATSKAIRAFCNERGMKAGITPIYPKFEDNFDLEKIAEVARYYDAYIVQAQDAQKDPIQRERMVKYLRELKEAIHRVNPRCLVGVQLGSADRFGDSTPGGGVRAALALYEATKDFIQIYTVWWEPDEQRMIQLLRAMEASSR